MGNPNIGNKDGIIPVGTIVWKHAVANFPQTTEGRRLRKEHSRLQPREWDADIHVVVKMRVTKAGVVPFDSRKRNPRRKRVFDGPGYSPERKCRVAEAEVVDIQVVSYKFREGDRITSYQLHPLHPKMIVRSTHDRRFLYRKGKRVTPRLEFDPDMYQVCRSGIHCFRTRGEAMRYAWGM
jgi:hypothetical protein